MFFLFPMRLRRMLRWKAASRLERSYSSRDGHRFIESLSSRAERGTIVECCLTTKGNGYENFDGSDVARQARRHRPENWVLARGTRCALLRIQGRGRRNRADLAEGRRAPAGPKEQRNGLSDRQHTPLR